MSSESRRIRQEAQLKPKFVNQKPTDDIGKNGDLVYLRDGNGVEEFVKDEGRWISLSTGRPAGEKAYIGRSTSRRVSGGGISTTGTSGGTANHNLLSNLNDDDHSQYVHNSSARNITARHTFKNSTPFIIDNDTLITNLNADKLDGHDESAFFRLSQNETVGGIPNFNGGENAILLLLQLTLII